MYYVTSQHCKHQTLLCIISLTPVHQGGRTKEINTSTSQYRIYHHKYGYKIHLSEELRAHI